MDDDPGKTQPSRWIGIEKETTPGTSVSPTFPQLWEQELVKALTTPPWLREYLDNQPPPPPPTFRQRLRRFWWRILDKWPLQWKDRSEDEWD